MALNVSATFNADIQTVLDHDVLPLAQRYLVAYQFAKKKKLESHMGTSWTATRYNRLSLPIAPVTEGVPPPGQPLTISQVTGQALQWADGVRITDVANLTLKHDLVVQAKRLLGLQVAETHERNTFNNLVSGTQVNYVNLKGSRVNLAAGDVLDPNTVNRTVSNLKNLGAPLFGGQSGETIDRQIEHNARASSKEPMTHEHYVSIGSPIVFNDFANNPTVVQAWSYSDVHRLYINEAGYWRGMHFCESNIIPTWVGVAAVTGTAGTTGNLATNANYQIQVTGFDTQNQYESRIYQVSSTISVTGPTGSISVTTPATAGFTYAIYIGTSASPQNLAVANWTGQVSQGPYAGMAIQIPPSTTVTLTGIGIFQTPPAAPTTGVTVFPTFVFGEDAFACLMLEKINWVSLFEADKSDPWNQLRMVTWKMFEGFVITNQNFMARIESSASNTGTFG